MLYVWKKSCTTSVPLCIKAAGGKKYLASSFRPISKEDSLSGTPYYQTWVAYLSFEVWDNFFFFFFCLRLGTQPQLFLNNTMFLFFRVIQMGTLTILKLEETNNVQQISLLTLYRLLTYLCVIYKAIVKTF